MKETINFCGKDNRGRLVDFFNSEKSVRFCGHKDIFQVKITECPDPDKATHWSWWDAEKNEFIFTHYCKDGVKICFPYSIKVYEEAGEGKLMPVVVEML